ncbi:MAG: hypothetical protein ACLGG0_01925 [Bacteriovoracia bacterium]
MSKNLLSRWFEVYQELGQPIGIHTFRVDKRDGQIEHQEHSHIEWDGFSLAVYKLRQLGWVIQPPRRLKSFSLSFLAKVKAFFHYLIWARVRDVRWKKFDAQRTGHNPPQIHVFEQEMTEKWLRDLAQQNLSPNAWLLHRLNKLTAPLIHSSEGIWWIPVDYRPYSDFSWDEPNVVSHIAVSINTSQNPRLIETFIQKNLIDGAPWAAWKWMQLIAKFGKTTMKGILQSQLKKNRWCGTMTYLGRWPNRFATAPVDTPYRLVGAPPPMLGHPISMGVSLMCDQLCVAFTSHCSLFSETESQMFFHDFLDEVSNGMKGQV